MSASRRQMTQLRYGRERRWRRACNDVRHGSPTPQMIEIVAIRLSGGSDHEHVTDLLWRGASTRAFLSTSVGQSTTRGIVDWLSTGIGNRAVLDDGSAVLPVLVVRPADCVPHVRAQLDGVWTDSLLALPTF